MLKKLGFTLLCAGSICSSAALAETAIPNPGISMEYRLPPNDPQIFTNAVFWTINATCRISTADNSDILYIQVLRNKGKINGSPVSSGDHLYLTVHPGEKLNITAESGAQVQLTNKGSHTVIANCDA